jgi:activator of HSP90 ATPase
VGGWHWTEKDVLPWAQGRLQALLGGLTLPGGFATGADVKVTGEATVNLRKKKLIPAYELAVSGTWQAAGGEGLEGTWALPYLADENQDEAPEVTAAVAPDAPPGTDKARSAFLAAAKVALVGKVAPFVREMAAGGPEAGNGESVGVGVVEVAKAGGAPSAPAAPAAPAAKAAAPAAADEASSSSKTATITRTERFYARRGDLWASLTDERRLGAATGAPAAIELKPGGRYTLYGGAVQGTVIEVDAPARLVLDWRFADWPEGCTSRVAMAFTEPESGTTVVDLQQTGVPTVDKTGAGGTVDRMESGWRDMVFDRIRRVFGYGVGL